MRRLALLLLLVATTGCGSVAPGRSAQCAWRVCVSHVDGPVGRDYRATNREPVPVTIVMIFRSVENLRLPPGRRVTTVVPPRTTVDLAHLRAIDASRPKGANVAIQIDLGSSTNPGDPELTYSMPFGGSEPRELVQGFGGPETHLASMHFSLDFAMPVGTPVLASREGTVLLVQDGFTEGGADPSLLERANLVVIAHSDGTMASYGHLSKGIRVRRDDRVPEGGLLGYSGATGFAGQPHLHFHVGSRMLGEPGRTIPIEMRDNHGHLVDLSVGSFFEPADRRMRGVAAGR
jgi:murein DD-endopeptidase MepM/ murein hydrolase activator NlpD